MIIEVANESVDFKKVIMGKNQALNFASPIQTVQLGNKRLEEGKFSLYFS